MTKIKFVTQVTLLGMIAVASAFVAISGVIFAFEAIMVGDDLINIAGPIAVTFIFSHLSADCILKAISKIQAFEKNGKS
jgi:hypothetical protein